MTIHHATLAKAAKLGVTLTEDPTTSQFGAYWGEKNKRAYAAYGAGAAAQLLDDMRVWQMIVREYAHLKVEQPHAKDANFVWEISLRGKVVGEGATLDDAFNDALDALAPKPSKKIVAVNGASDDEGEEGDEDGEGDGFDESDPDGEPAEASEGDEDEEDNGKSVVKKSYKRAYRPFKHSNGDELRKLISAHVKVKDPNDGKLRVNVAKLTKFAKMNGVWSDDDKLKNVGMKSMNIANRLRARLRHEPDYQIVWN